MVKAIYTTNLSCFTEVVVMMREGESSILGLFYEFSFQWNLHCKYENATWKWVCKYSAWKWNPVVVANFQIDLPVICWSNWCYFHHPLTVSCTKDAHSFETCFTYSSFNDLTLNSLRVLILINFSSDCNFCLLRLC